MSVVSTSPSSKPADTGVLKLLRANLQTYVLIAVLVLSWLFFSVATKGLFLGPQNFSNLFRQMTVTALMSVGMVLVIVTGNIDLSVGKLAGFVSVVVAYLQAKTWSGSVLSEEALTTTFAGLVGLFGSQENLKSALELITTILSVVIGVGVGVLVGVVQGYIIAYWRVASFIVTLGGQWILNGLLLLVTEGKTIAANQPKFQVISQGYLPMWAGWTIAGLTVLALLYMMYNGRQKKMRYGFDLPPLWQDFLKTGFFVALVGVYVYVVNQYNGVPNPVLLLAIVAIAVAYISNNTRFGRYAYAIGGNREAARLSGVNIRNNIFLVFVMMGFLCGVAGVALASYVGFGTIGAGSGYELDVIAACILGGTSTLGGEGTVLGALVGALIMASLSTGLQMLNVAPATQYVVKGIVLVIAVLIDVQLKKNR